MLSTLKVEHFRTTEVEACAVKYPDLTRSESIFHSYIIYLFIHSFVLKCFIFYFILLILKERDQH